jgi:GYF domain 2
VLVTETTTEENVWYLARDGKQHGPLTHLEMTKLVELGHLRTADLVWRPGFDNWRPAPTVFDFAPAPPPPKPAVTTPQASTAMRTASAPSDGATATPKSEPASPSPASQSAQSFSTAVQSSAAARPQPSFAGLSAAVEPVKPEPARFEFPRETAARIDASRAATPAAHDPEPQPFSIDTRGIRPAGSTSQFGSPTTSDEPALEPFRMEPSFEEPAPKKGRGVAVALGLLIAIGGLSAAGYTFRDTIKATLNSATGTTADLPVVEAPAEANGPAPNAAGTTASPPADQAAAPPQPSEPAAVVATADPQSTTGPATLPGVVANQGPVDAEWQASPFWSLAKAEFPQWYADRVREAGDMKAANQPDADINRKLVEAIVVLRRQNASKALAASPDRLKIIAEAFVTNLGAMQSQSVDACYDFIGKGELTPAAAALVQKPAEGPALHAQLSAVFTAVIEGQKNPIARTSPQTTDYNLLAAELGTIGWSQADIQLFADPKALSAAPRDRVCRMVKDWFSAHLAVKDDAARERLLFETLRLVIAG